MGGELITAAGARDITRAEAGDLYGRFLDFLDISNPATLKTYANAIRQFARAFAGTAPAAITPRDIRDWRNSLLEGHRPATVQLYLVAVRRFFSWAEAEGLIRKNPAQGIKGARADRGFKKDYLTAHQAHEILEEVEAGTVKGKRDKAIIALMITAGLRTIEVRRADIADLRPLGDKTVLYVQGKGHTEKADFVEVPAGVEKLIREYLAARGEKEGPLFAAESNHNRGGRMATGSISRLCKGAMIAAGLNSDRLTAHSFRHTAATLSLLGGRSLAEVQQLLRHTNINTTMIYQHALERAQNQCAATVAGMVL